jgi:hypothetical protein
MDCKPDQTMRLTVPIALLALAWMLLLSGGAAWAEGLASEVNSVLKQELEEEFGPLADQIMADETKMWGRLISIDYQLPEGTRLDDSWGDKAVAALARLGVAAEFDGSEVRADGETIAGKEALSMQLTTSRGVDEPDAIAFTAMFPPGS